MNPTPTLEHGARDRGDAQAARPDVPTVPLAILWLEEEWPALFLWYGGPDPFIALLIRLGIQYTAGRDPVYKTGTVPREQASAFRPACLLAVQLGFDRFERLVGVHERAASHLTAARPDVP